MIDFSILGNYIFSFLISLIGGILLFKYRSSQELNKKLNDTIIQITSKVIELEERLRQYDIRIIALDEIIRDLTREVANDRVVLAQQIGILKDALISAIDTTTTKRYDEFRQIIRAEVERIWQNIEGLRIDIRDVRNVK